MDYSIAINREWAKRRLVWIERRIAQIDHTDIFDANFNAGRKERDKLEREALTHSREMRLGAWNPEEQ